MNSNKSHLNFENQSSRLCFWLLKKDINFASSVTVVMVPVQMCRKVTEKKKTDTKVDTVYILFEQVPGW